MNRRTFLKIAGAGGLSIAAGCTSKPEKTLYGLLHAPDDLVAGEPTWYASTCRECPAGCGILAKNREGRIVKVEGNPLHPINEGTLCMRGQAAVQGIYSPDRIKAPLLMEKDRWRPLSYSQAEKFLRERANAAAQNGENKVRMVTEVVGETLLGLAKECLQRWRSHGLLVFEPYGYESLKAANRSVFGIEGLPSYRLEEADLVVSFGADFLETWLSPVEYARKFKTMHTIDGQRKGLFIQVSPYQSVTCASADYWLSCEPGTEAAVALGLIREALEQGRGKDLPEHIRPMMNKIASPYTTEMVLAVSGVVPVLYEQLVAQVLRSQKPLVLGIGTGGSGFNDVRAQVAVNLLNLVLDPDLTLFDFENRHRVERAAKRSELQDFITGLGEDGVELLLLNNVNPVHTIAGADKLKAALAGDSLFVVSFSNFMDETTRLANLILPVTLPLESWDEYGGKLGVFSTLQPAMGSLTGAPGLGDILLRAARLDESPPDGYGSYLLKRAVREGRIQGEQAWLRTLRRGGIFEGSARSPRSQESLVSRDLSSHFTSMDQRGPGHVFIAAPSIRFFDGRGANRPWLCEVPDPLTKVAWHTPVLVHPKTLEPGGLKEGDLIRIESTWGDLEAPVYETVGVKPGVLVMAVGQGHEAYGRYAEGMGLNPFILLSPGFNAAGGPLFGVGNVSIKKTNRSMKLARTDGSRFQHGRKIALSVPLGNLDRSVRARHEREGLSMFEFPLTLPLPEGYNRRRDFYPPHKHEEYRWAMVVDLDRCIGCAACATACYAENNLGVVGLERILEGREMSWLMVQRYLEEEHPERIIFLPMLCQHCDNAPCESVCPVFAPHHSKEGLNNQIYNRCIGTRFCSQNCPYKVRRFNWFDWQWPSPLHLQLNPDITVRKKGVMEKCSFCVQRIKEAHNQAKDEKRSIRDGEVQPACAQTCPTKVFTFGNLMDKNSRVRKLVGDKRAYQVMGYLNTKPAVIYLKKVIRA